MKNLLLALILVSYSLDLSSQNHSAKSSIPDLNIIFKPMKWRNIGPFRGGRSVAVSGVIGDPMSYYMGTTGGGLWKTDDAGQHWYNISDGYFKTGSVGAVEVAVSDPNVVYCGMGEHAVRGVMTHHGDGVYKSTDAGATWKKMGLDATQHIAGIAIHPQNPDIVYVAAQGALYSKSSERGIYRSTDGGISWKKILYVDDKTGCSHISMDMNNPRILYAAMWEHGRLPWKVLSGGPGSGLYKSTDGGDSWEKIQEGLPKELGKMSISVSKANSNKVYALVESDSEKAQGGLFVSDNGGKNWSKVSGDNRLVQRAWYYIEVFADPQNENLVYVLSAPALYSIDGGKSWDEITGTHMDFHHLWINPNNPKNMVIANDGGAAITFNRGKTWSTQDNMPTAQMYRINVDNAFPYNIYGGQQDNTSVKIASREFNSGGITARSWTYSAGGESAFLAFDPDNPRYVLGGSYLGSIEVLDTKGEAGTNIMAAPILFLGRESKDMKYRFNWNAPIVWSKHYPNTYFHGAQYLLQTQDMGQNWKEISPDLTKNEKEKQGKGGGPYTNEAVGAENYGTISYIAESPHEKGVIWVGTDDGLVQLTKDGGKTWANVTPAGLKESLVNSIDVSPHDPATAYIATTRYKFNDHTPALYKTSDYGKTWTNISKGIAQGAFTRVVREDDKRKGLLFAGTETGVYISWDAGQNWMPFQLNLPITPITDLMVKHDDLIAATSGRSFWILDDLELLRQYEAANSSFKIIKPEDAMLVNGSSELNGDTPEFKGTNPFRGVNPATGAVIYYQIPDNKDSSEISLEIRDADGLLVRSFSSKKDSGFSPWDGGPPTEPVLPNKAGLNRFVWDLRHPSMKGVPDVYIEGSYKGHKASPGTYFLILKMGNDQATTTLKLRPNPRYPTSEIAYQEYNRYMLEMENTLSTVHLTVNAMLDYRTQIETVLKKLPPEDKYKSVGEMGQNLIRQMTDWDNDLVQRKSKAYDDVENFENKLTGNYLFLINHTESDIPRVTESGKARKKELDEEWSRLRDKANGIIGVQLPAFNKKLWEAGVGAVILSSEKP
jgi:photosystem II stability/assembly factor-like uncharacterized protein